MPPAGCFDEFTYNFEIVGEGDTLTFVPLIDPALNVTAVMWDFGDGSAVVSDPVPTTVVHTFPYTGNFNVCMSVQTDNDCDGNICRNVYSDCVPDAQLIVGNQYEVRASTNTEPPATLAPAPVALGISMCDIPDELSGQVLMAWVRFDVSCCATDPQYFEPRVQGNYPSNTCVRTGAEEFTYTINNCTGGGNPRVVKISSPAFNVGYSGPYGVLNVPVMFSWVSGVKGGAGCNCDIVWRYFGCAAQDTSLVGYFTLSSLGAPC